MKFKIKGILYLACIGLAVTSCKKDEDDDNTTTPITPATKTELLTGPLWKTTALTATQGTTVIDLYAQGDDCDNDDIENFIADGSWITTEGATTCEPNDPDTIGVDTWEFVLNETAIVTDGDTINIESLTATTLTFVEEIDFGTDDVTTWTQTFTAQ